MSGNATTDVFKLIGYIQDDLRSVQAKFVSLRAQLAALNLPQPKAYECPLCGVRLQAAHHVKEHLELVHDGSGLCDRCLGSGVNNGGVCPPCQGSGRIATITTKGA